LNYLKALFHSAILLIAVSSLSSHAEISVGKPLPALQINEDGELLLSNDNFSFAAWDSKVLGGDGSKPRVHTLQYVAGRQKASDLNKPLTDTLAEMNFPLEKHLVTTIVNIDDAMWGTAGFVSAELESKKRLYKHSSIVADKKGDGQKTWELSKKNSAIAIVSSRGKVLFFKEGALNAKEIDTVLGIITEQIGEL